MDILVWTSPTTFSGLCRSSVISQCIKSNKPLCLVRSNIFGGRNINNWISIMWLFYLVQVITFHGEVKNWLKSPDSRPYRDCVCVCVYVCVCSYVVVVVGVIKLYLYFVASVDHLALTDVGRKVASCSQSSSWSQKNGGVHFITGMIDVYSGPQQRKWILCALA